MLYVMSRVLASFGIAWVVMCVHWCGASAIKLADRRVMGRNDLNNDDAGAFVLPQLEVQKICTCVVVFCLLLPFLALSFVPGMLDTQRRMRACCPLTLY